MKEVNNIFHAWIIFRRVSYKNSRLDILHIINETNNSKLTNANITHFISGDRAVPDNILILIENDFDVLLPWILNNCGLDIENLNIELLKNYFGFAIKRLK